MSVPRVCRFKPSHAASVATTQANLSLLDGFLDVLALDGGEVCAAEHAALAGAGIDANRFARQRLRQLRREPVGRVVVLAEDDAAMLQPCFAFGAMLGEEVADGRQLRVARFRARELVRRSSAGASPRRE